MGEGGHPELSNNENRESVTGSVQNYIVTPSTFDRYPPYGDFLSRWHINYGVFTRISYNEEVSQEMLDTEYVPNMMFSTIHHDVLNVLPGVGVAMTTVGTILNTVLPATQRLRGRRYTDVHFLICRGYYGADA